MMGPEPSDFQISCNEVAEKLRRGDAFELIDIRGPEFQSMARIEGAKAATEELMDGLLAMPKETEIVFHCHHGISSLDVTAFFLEQGFVNAKSMTGGIAAWSEEVDPTVPRY